MRLGVSWSPAPTMVNTRTLHSISTTCRVEPPVRAYIHPSDRHTPLHLISGNRPVPRGKGFSTDGRFMRVYCNSGSEAETCNNMRSNASRHTVVNPDKFVPMSNGALPLPCPDICFKRLQRGGESGQGVSKDEKSKRNHTHTPHTPSRNEHRQSRKIQHVIYDEGQRHVAETRGPTRNKLRVPPGGSPMDGRVHRNFLEMLTSSLPSSTGAPFVSRRVMKRYPWRRRSRRMHCHARSVPLRRPSSSIRNLDHRVSWRNLLG